MLLHVVLYRLHLTLGFWCCLFFTYCHLYSFCTKVHTSSTNLVLFLVQKINDQLCLLRSLQTLIAKQWCEVPKWTVSCAGVMHTFGQSICIDKEKFFIGRRTTQENVYLFSVLFTYLFVLIRKVLLRVFIYGLTNLPFRKDGLPLHASCLNTRFWLQISTWLVVTSRFLKKEQEDIPSLHRAGFINLLSLFSDFTTNLSSKEYWNYSISPFFALVGKMLDFKRFLCL